MAAKTSWKNYVTDFPTAEKFARGEGSSDTRRWIITVGSTQLREPVRSLAVRKELHEILNRPTDREGGRETDERTDGHKRGSAPRTIAPPGHMSLFPENHIRGHLPLWLGLELHGCCFGLRLGLFGLRLGMGVRIGGCFGL